VAGYSGLEHLVALWAMELNKLGCEVSVVAPEASDLGEGIEIIPVPFRCSEEQAYMVYKARLTQFDAVMDNTWLWHTVLLQMETDHQLPIIHIWHSDPQGLGSPPPIKYPCIVSLSQDQGSLITMKWGFITCTVYNGIDLQVYKADPSIRRSDRYLFMGRYSTQKCALEAAFLGKKCKVPVDLYGDTEIIGSREYLERVKSECDGSQVVFHEGVPREEVVKLYQNHKALIHLVNYNEAFGLVPVEAMSCGMPVIVNRRGALPETVVDGKSGFVVNSLEEAEAIIREDRVSTIKAEDCVEQAKKFGIEKSAQGHLKLFDEVANQHIYW